MNTELGLLLIDYAVGVVGEQAVAIFLKKEEAVILPILKEFQQEYYDVNEDLSTLEQDELIEAMTKRYTQQLLAL